VSVFLSEWPAVPVTWVNPEIERRWAVLLALRQHVLKELEKVREAGKIGDSLEAKVIFYRKPDQAPGLIENYLPILPSLYLVSQVYMTVLDEPRYSASGLTKATLDSDGNGKAATEIGIAVDRADGEKCQRCWKYSESVGRREEYANMCESCSAILEEDRKR
jgi:isoleucyl-tRNA synthetase